MWLSTTSPLPPSTEPQQLTPLMLSTSRVGSYALTSLAILAWSYCPQPSFWSTHMTSDGELRCWSMIAWNSASHWVRAAESGLLPVSMAGMSCHTRRPSLSAQ